VTIKNIGHSVATNIENVMSADLPLLKCNDPIKQPIKDQKKMCDMWREVRSRPNSSVNPVVLFPGQTYAENSHLEFSKTQLDQARINPNRPTPVDFVTGVIIIGCIDYTFVFASEHHQTGYIMEVFKPTPEHFGSLSIRMGGECSTIPIVNPPISFWRVLRRLE
jgi:hypothetical protein